ncbi:VanZ family protein [Acidaminobacter hydrogenoformans]|uniref:VanZ like family protein n=1 Tax=Acidaminobacter hydrogenoformans DSM 2784 TaxID=1120920 RepID=A0A1G5S098_9FIRM|nr:VanZ family protein [Acidaminobacter hydrogenoformans]SCZ79009.1 VanZ like family protein [Acidaminobacter hydrogenoformans DSM 2784]
MKRVLTLLLAASWVAVICWFSSQAMQETTQQTYEVIVRLGLATKSELILSTDPSIVFLIYLARKGAHLLLFMVLGGFVTLAFFSVTRRRGLRLVMPAWLISGLIGVVDEVHQHFVPGRIMQFSDMALDAGGALLGVLLSWMLISVFVAIGQYMKKEKRKLDEVRRG